MKTYAIFLLVFAACFTINAQSFEIYNGDTINSVDANKLKQGKWVVFINEKSVLETGKYSNNLKTGLWIKYWNNGNVQYEINYENGFPRGEVKFYYPSGKLQEQGIWELNKWVGKYQFYFQNGQAAYRWNFDSQGKRSGEQKYFFENGNTRIEGTWDKGKISGTLKEFYENGAVKAERVYNSEGFNKSLSKTFPPNPKFELERNNVKVMDKPEIFDGNGFHKMFSINGLLLQEGEYVKGVMNTGKKYHYNDKSILIKTEIIEKGVLVKTIE
ncbi:MAG TPA: hypothetical protein DCQ31_00415 [Bacteroidales bacterium]|nr:hypothetical protein [Bacteroidales bacterium]